MTTFLTRMSDVNVKKVFVILKTFGQYLKKISDV